MAKPKKSSHPICPVRNTDCCAYSVGPSGKRTCGILIDIDDILSGKEQCRREIEHARRVARESGGNH